MPIHGILMLAGLAALVLAAVMSAISMAQAHAPVNGARVAVLGVVAMVASAFLNPAPFSLADVTGPVNRLMAQSGGPTIVAPEGERPAAPAPTPAPTATAKAPVAPGTPAPHMMPQRGPVLAPPPAVMLPPGRGPVLARPPIFN